MLRAALTRCWSGGGSVGSWTGLPPRRFDSARQEHTWARHTRDMVSWAGHDLREKTLKERVLTCVWGRAREV